MICTLKKGTSFLLTLLVLLQSCQIYNKTSVSLEKASQAELPVKLITKTKEKSIYRKIVLENQEYYGIDHKNGNWVKYPLEQENIEKLFLKDKKKSTWATVGMFLGITIILVFVFINNEEFVAPNIY
ncbi:hypothetical protein [Eudoraea sp.]|uniref:hypothetical protein n=1 Tax=Eudoraea sp. TaxID=1979955 RepID=UPI003C728E7F